MTNTTQTAHELTTEQVVTILTQPLEAASLFLAAGVKFFDTPGRPVRVPSLGGPVAVNWVGESEEIPDDTQVDFGEVTLLPTTMKSVKVITRYSSELARSSVVALEAALRTRLVTDVAAKIDGQFFSASGDGITTPQGMFAWTGVQTLPVGGTLTYDALLAAWGMALTGNVNMSSLRWVMTPREFVTLKGIKDGDGRYLAQPDVTADGVFRVFGIPVLVTGRVPDTTGATPTGRAALVDFSQIAVARDLNPTVTVLRERYAEFDEQALRVVARYDVKPLNPTAVVRLTGITV